MDDAAASHTALSVSLMRARHTRADPEPIISDPWGDKLVPGSVVEAIKAQLKEPNIDAWLRGSAAYANVIVRSRYTEDALHASIARGVKQYVLIGAGFDSYALRAPAAAEQLQIFEVDHPATQALKRQRLTECQLSVKDSVHFLPADLSRESLGDVLSRSTFDPSRLTFFSWLGVTMYLTREANLAALAGIARCAAPGSELVFSYIDQQLFSAAATPTAEVFDQLQQRVSSVGEPFISGFDPQSLTVDLRDVGFELEQDLDDTVLIQRYDPTGVNGLQSASVSHIARARVVGASA